MADNAQAASGSVINTGRVVGAIQVVGGVLEVALGVGAMGAPTGVTQVGGVILIGHGTDTVIAGFRSLWYGEVKQSGTQQGASWAAKELGASDQTAQRIGTGVDIAAGVGPSLAVSVSRQLAIEGAKESTERVAIFYLHRSAWAMGHNAIGIRQAAAEGATEAWVHFAGTPIGEVLGTTRDALIRNALREQRLLRPGARFVITELAVNAKQAAQAAARATSLQVGEQAWRYLGPNCTTTVLQVLKEAGIVMPLWSRTPALLHIGATLGPQITLLGGVAASGSAALGKVSGGKP